MYVSLTLHNRDKISVDGPYRETGGTGFWLLWSVVDVCSP